MLRQAPNREIALEIKRDLKRAKSLKEASKTNKGALNPADFTKFMGSHHDQNQEVIELAYFLPLDLMKNEIEIVIWKEKKNK